MEKKTLKVAVIGLKMGNAWARAARELPTTELVMVYDKFFNENTAIDHKFYLDNNIPLAGKEEDIYNSDADIVVVATPDHFHTDQCIAALKAGKHVACEKPLASTVAECLKIAAAVKESGKMFMTGQVCRYAPAFKLAKKLLNEGRIGELVSLECEYAHDYTKYPGFNNWRKDPAIGREGFLGGGCHALDLARWLAGDPEEVFCYMNKKHMPDWPKPDTGFAVAKFPAGVIGRVFVSIGVKRPYTTRTVINGTKGTIICDNTSDTLQISEESVYSSAGKVEFQQIPVLVSSHNVRSELAEFASCILAGQECPTNVIQGLKTVAFAEAAIESNLTGKAVKVNYHEEECK